MNPQLSRRSWLASFLAGLFGLLSGRGRAAGAPAAPLSAPPPAAPPVLLSAATGCLTTYTYDPSADPLVGVTAITFTYDPGRWTQL